MALGCYIEHTLTLSRHAEFVCVCGSYAGVRAWVHRVDVLSPILQVLGTTIH